MNDFISINSADVLLVQALPELQAMQAFIAAHGAPAPAFDALVERIEAHCERVIGTLAAHLEAPQ